MSVITIIGSGMMGSAIGMPAAANGHEIRLVGTPLDTEIINQAHITGNHITLKRPLPSTYRFYQFDQAKEALDGASCCVCGVSSFGLEWFLHTALPLIPDDMPVLMVTKGMLDREDGSLISYPEYYKEHYPHKHINGVGGPCTSYELADRDPTEVSFCGWDLSELRFLKSLFATDWYHVSLSTDVRGVECAVAMKNAYALAVTLAVGMAQARDGRDDAIHYNSQAALFGQSVREMRRLLALCGGGDDNIILGAGDLYVTVFGGRTRFIGTLLGRGLTFEAAMDRLKGVTLESIVIAERTGRAVHRLIDAGKVAPASFPLLLHVYDVLKNGASAKDIPWSAFETETEI